MPIIHKGNINLLIFRPSLKKTNTITPEPKESDSIILKFIDMEYTCKETYRFNDSVRVMECNGYRFDSMGRKESAYREFIQVQNKNTLIPYGWSKYYDHKGKIRTMIQYRVNIETEKEDVSQIIHFGSDSMDTLYNKSNFIRHKITNVTTDSFSVLFHAYLADSSFTKYSFSLLDSTYESFNKSHEFKLPIEDSIDIVFITGVKINSDSSIKQITISNEFSLRN